MVGWRLWACRGVGGVFGRIGNRLPDGMMRERAEVEENSQQLRKHFHAPFDGAAKSLFA